MNRSALLVSLILLSANAQADTITLVCEYDSSYHTEKGRLSSNAGSTIFRVIIDVDSEKLVAPHFLTTASVRITEDSLIWLDRRTADDIWIFEVNRHTGTMYLRREGEKNVFFSLGQCVVPKRLF